MEEGDEERMTRDRNELRRIVEYNDARMGLPSRERSRAVSAASQEGFGGGESGEALGSERRVVTYRSEGHPRDTLAALKTLQQSRVLTDLCLIASSNQSIEVHAPVLAAVSSLLREKLKADGDGGACGTSLCLVPEVDHAGLQAVVEFAYSGAAASPFNKDNVHSTRAAAQTLGVARLVQLCDRGVEPSRKKDSPGQREEEEMKATLQSIELLWADKVRCDVTLDLDEMSFHGRHRLILKNHIFITSIAA